MSLNVCYRKFDSKRKFGIELEVNNTVPKSRLKKIIQSVCDRPVQVTSWGTDVDNDYWHVKEDSSCGPQGLDGPRGLEIASYVGSGIGDIIRMSHVADALRDKKVVVTDFCGMHIHADCHDLSTEQMGTIVAYWLKIEYMIGLTLPSRRRGGEFCRYMQQKCRWRVDRTRSYRAGDIWDLYKPQNLSQNDNDDRRATLNLVNYARGIWYSWVTRKTIELRWPEGTVEGSNVKNWLRLFLNFIDNVKDRGMPDDTSSAGLEDVLTILGLHHDADNFLILSEGLMETKAWFLERLVHFGAEDSFYSGGKNKQIKQAKAILNQMWSPIKKYKPSCRCFWQREKHSA